MFHLCVVFVAKSPDPEGRELGRDNATEPDRLRQPPPAPVPACTERGSLQTTHLQPGRSVLRKMGSETDYLAAPSSYVYPPPHPGGCSCFVSR